MKLNRPPRILDWIVPSLTWRFAVSEPVIFLTFDDGPNPEITPFVLDLLNQYQWKATFFCVGENCLRYPELLQRIIDEGHAIGNHTMKHENASKIDPKTYLESVKQFDAHFKTKLFRPPYGRISRVLSSKISKSHQIIMWSWLSYDYDLSYSTKRILQNAERIVAGDIIVLHDNSKLTVRHQELLPNLFELIQSKGFCSKKIEMNQQDKFHE